MRDVRPQAMPGERVHEEHELRDVVAKPILGVLAVMGVVAVILHFGLWFLVRQFVGSTGFGPPPPGAAARGPQTPPEPRLQISPMADLAAVRREEQAAISSYGWVDSRAGVARIPVDRAMDLLVQRGLPPAQPRWRDLNAPTPLGAGVTTGQGKRGSMVPGGAISPSAVLPQKPEDLRRLETQSLGEGL